MPSAPCSCSTAMTCSLHAAALPVLPVLDLAGPKQHARSAPGARNAVMECSPAEIARAVQGHPRPCQHLHQHAPLSCRHIRLKICRDVKCRTMRLGIPKAKASEWSWRSGRLDATLPQLWHRPPMLQRQTWLPRCTNTNRMPRYSAACATQCRCTGRPCSSACLELPAWQQRSLCRLPNLRHCSTWSPS